MVLVLFRAAVVFELGLLPWKPATDTPALLTDVVPFRGEEEEADMVEIPDKWDLAAVELTLKTHLKSKSTPTQQFGTSNSQITKTLKIQC